jgi:hypothetical protein
MPESHVPARARVGSFLDDLVDESGSVNWCEAPSGSYGSFGSGGYGY